MKEKIKKLKGCEFFVNDYGSWRSEKTKPDNITEENINSIGKIIIKTNDSVKELSNISLFNNIHTLRIERCRKVEDFSFISNLKKLKDLFVEDTPLQNGMDFLSNLNLEKVTLYDESGILIDSLPKTLTDLKLNGSFEYSYLSSLENLNELFIDNSSGNKLLDEVKDLPDEYELPLLPKSITYLGIRGSCKLKSNRCLDNLNNDCKIYIPDKGCENLIIPERFTNVSR